MVGIKFVLVNLFFILDCHIAYLIYPYIFEKYSVLNISQYCKKG